MQVPEELNGLFNEIMQEAQDSERKYKVWASCKTVNDAEEVIIEREYTADSDFEALHGFTQYLRDNKQILSFHSIGCDCKNEL